MSVIANQSINHMDLFGWCRISLIVNWTCQWIIVSGVLRVLKHVDVNF